MGFLYTLTYEILNLENLPITFKIQKEIWPNEQDYEGLYEKAIHSTEDNCVFLVYDKDVLIGITGVDVDDNYPDTIWLYWFAILSEYRKKGYGTKMLLDTIQYCKELNKYDFFRLDTTYYENRPALFLYDKVMQLKENYTIEDTKEHKNDFLIYSYSLNGKLKPWKNKYLGLRDYYDNCKKN